MTRRRNNRGQSNRGHYRPWTPPQHCPFHANYQCPEKRLHRPCRPSGQNRQLTQSTRRIQPRSNLEGNPRPSNQKTRKTVTFASTRATPAWIDPPAAPTIPRRHNHFIGSQTDPTISISKKMLGIPTKVINEINMEAGWGDGLNDQFTRTLILSDNDMLTIAQPLLELLSLSGQELTDEVEDDYDQVQKVKLDQKH